MQSIGQKTFEKKKDWKFDLWNPETVYLIALPLKVKIHWSDLFFSPKFIFLHFLITHTPEVSQMCKLTVGKITVTTQIEERWNSWNRRRKLTGWLCILLSPLLERRGLRAKKTGSLKLCLTLWQSSELPPKLYLDLKQTSEETPEKCLVPFPREVEGEMNQDP